jgi:hypothetical protein
MSPMRCVGGASGAYAYGKTAVSAGYSVGGASVKIRRKGTFGVAGAEA